MLGVEKLDTDSFEAKAADKSFRPVPLEEYMRKKEGIPYILNISKGRLDNYIRNNFDEIAEAVRDTGILIGNTGWIERFSEAGVKVYGDYGLNVYNRQAELAYEELGAELYMPSHETGISDGRGIPLMVTEHPVSASALTDRKGVVHKVAVPPSGDKTLIY
jgi:hypothetical protein